MYLYPSHKVVSSKFGKQYIDVKFEDVIYKLRVKN